MSSKLKKIEEAIAKAAYPDIHPDFTDAGWERMAAAALEALLEPDDSMVAAALATRERLGMLSSQARPVAEFNAMIRAVLAA